MSVVCTQCTTSEESIEFDSLADFVSHQRGGHISRPPKPTPPPVKPVTPSATELKAMKEKAQYNVPIEGQTQLIPEDPPPLKPLNLEYRWTGQHKCGTEPRTIEVNLGNEKLAIVAFCFGCNETIGQLEVPEIPRRLTNTNPAPISKKK